MEYTADRTVLTHLRPVSESPEEWKWTNWPGLDGLSGVEGLCYVNGVRDRERLTFVDGEVERGEQEEEEDGEEEEWDGGGW